MKEKLLYTILILFTLGIGGIAFLIFFAPYKGIKKERIYHTEEIVD